MPGSRNIMCVSVLGCESVCVPDGFFAIRRCHVPPIHTRTHTHTHTQMYIYMYMYIYDLVCMYMYIINSKLNPNT